MTSGWQDLAVLLSFGLGLFTALLGVAAKYAMDYRLGRRQLELDERAAITAALGNGPGLLRRAAVRLRDRAYGCFRDAEHIGKWLSAGPAPDQDNYFLRTFVQRMFMFFSAAGVVQSAIDALPGETLAARNDLRQLYALIELAKASVTNVGLLCDYPGFVVDAEDHHLFIGALDDLADLGMAAYSTHGGTIPAMAFSEFYDGGQPTLIRLRAWLSAAACPGGRAAAVLARLACLEAALNAILAPPAAAPACFASDTALHERLTAISLPPNGLDYSFTSAMPERLDQLLPGILRT
jgi:hypothetical protein